MSRKFYENKKRRSRECESKVRHPDNKSAMTAINAAFDGRVQRRRGRPEYLRAYPCNFCNGWHLTKQD